jgi:23S rRNA (guanosine2251-2'-O)-methyltransferase
MAQNHTLLWGYHPVWEALQARRRKMYGLFMAQDKKGRREKMARLAGEAGVRIQWASLGELTEMVGHDRHQGIAAQVAGYPFVRLEQVLSVDPKAPFVLVLDQIVDPQNLGAMARTAQCAGIHGIVITKDRAAMPTAAASKASAGALEHMPLVRVTNPQVGPIGSLNASVAAAVLMYEAFRQRRN